MSVLILGRRILLTLSSHLSTTFPKTHCCFSSAWKRQSWSWGPYTSWSSLGRTKKSSTGGLASWQKIGSEELSLDSNPGWIRAQQPACVLCSMTYALPATLRNVPIKPTSSGKSASWVAAVFLTSCTAGLFPCILQLCPLCLEVTTLWLIF